MLTREENELLCRVGSGTPAGELLRRYWQPVAVAGELNGENPTKFVRILGEDLVLFQDKSGRVGLIADRCSHRGASLLYGRVEERGIACPYHGWLYDTEGRCLETPAEPSGSNLRLTIKHPAYPVQKFIGLYWAYLGPLPAPLIPNYDVWARRDGKRTIVIQPQLDCNWFQAMENSVDPAHLQILHQDTAKSMSRRKSAGSTKGFINDVEEFEFYELPYGIMKKRVYKSGLIDEHPLIFPNINREGNTTQIRVPIDDTHTWHIFIRFDPTEDGGLLEEKEDTPVEKLKPYKEPPQALHPIARFRTDLVMAQDHMTWETQGPIADRSRERLATSDQGVVMLRAIVKREIAKVQRGLDPMGIIRGPEQHQIIDTNLSQTLRQMAEIGRLRTVR
jgi:5,5'-dehydrodivanillate O-demethylase